MRSSCKDCKEIAAGLVKETKAKEQDWPGGIDYSTSPRNRDPANRNHLDICLSSSQKNRNSLGWVLVALTVCFTYPVLHRVSAESRAGEWEL